MRDGSVSGGKLNKIRYLHNFMKFIFAAVLSFTTYFTWAQQPSDASMCISLEKNERTLQHCNNAIAAGKYSGEMLAELHHHRGKHWAERGEVERAIQDFDAALKLRPAVAKTHHARAAELTTRGDYALALADFDMAQKLDAKSDIAFGKGRTLFYIGNAEAVSTLEDALKAQPNIYIALWLYLARKGAGVPDADEQLERDTRRLRSGWPAPLVAFYMGRTDEQSILNGATDSDPVRRNELRCEADFYLAHGHLHRNQPDAKSRAQKLLRQVETTCPKNLLEYEGAVAELRRIK